MKMISKWWDGYKDQEIVLIDDFELDSLTYMGHYLKLWADPFGKLSGEIKGATVNLNYKVLYVTSNYSIMACVEAIAKKTSDGSLVDMELYHALKRRFTEYEMTD